MCTDIHNMHTFSSENWIISEFRHFKKLAEKNKQTNKSNEGIGTTHPKEMISSLTLEIRLIQICTVTALLLTQTNVFEQSNRYIVVDLCFQASLTR